MISSTTSPGSTTISWLTGRPLPPDRVAEEPERCPASAHQAVGNGERCRGVAAGDAQTLALGSVHHIDGGVAHAPLWGPAKMRGSAAGRKVRCQGRAGEETDNPHVA